MFPKYDGSNIRAEWSPKKGFSKFGSRKVLIGDDALLAAAIPLLREHEDALAKIFRGERWERVICFFEYWGPKSFAGLHEPGDVMSTTLIDLDVFKRGQIDPRDFIKLTEGLPNVAQCIGTRFNAENAGQVRDGTFEGQTDEGVVCKVPSSRKWEPPYMFKSKRSTWIERVYALHGSRAEEFL